MKLAIYSLKKILFQGEARFLNCKTEVGEITVLDHHKPLIGALEKSVIKVIDKNEKEWYIPVSSGFIEVRADNETRLIVEEE